MKIIKLIFFILAAAGLIIGAGIFLFFQTFDTGRYLSQITQKASLALGRQVTVGYLGLGLSLNGITLDAAPVTITDDPDFTSQPFIKVERVRISLDLKSLVLHRKIRVTGILLQSPQIHFILSREGNINVRSIGRASPVPGGKGPATTGAGRSSSDRIAAGTQGNNYTNNDSRSFKFIKIQDADISFINQNESMFMDFWLRNVNADMEDVSLSSLRAGRISMTDPAVIKNFNVIKISVSNAVGVFGGMDGFIDKLGADDTVIKQVQADFSFHDRTVFVDDAMIRTNLLEFTAKGQINQGLDIDMQTALHLNNDVSAILLNDLEGLKYLCDDSKRITIDAGLKGVIPHLKYKPTKDFRKKSRKVFMAEGGNILSILLGGR